MRCAIRRSDALLAHQSVDITLKSDGNTCFFNQVNDDGIAVGFIYIIDY